MFGKRGNHFIPCIKDTEYEHEYSNETLEYGEDYNEEGEGYIDEDYVRIVNG